MEDATYITVFYDIELPKNCENAMYKRVTKNLYYHLIDKMSDAKTVELLRHDGVVNTYKVIDDIVTFHVYNSIDNCFYAICNVSKTIK